MKQLFLLQFVRIYFLTNFYFLAVSAGYYPDGYIKSKHQISLLCSKIIVYPYDIFVEEDESKHVNFEEQYGNSRELIKIT